jgi:hypothetical protein
MRKRVVNPVPLQRDNSEHQWLDIEKLAVVEMTSEHSQFPIESALLLGNASGWRALESGEQSIRLIFDEPQKIQHIRLNFEEFEVERTQEYVLCCSSDNGKSFQEVVRQQWNFSPEGATSEYEDFQVDLSDVTILELRINPDINRNDAFASVKMLRVA